MQALQGDDLRASDEKIVEPEHIQQFPAQTSGDYQYEDADTEPEIHARTWFAVLALFFLNYVQLVALTGPPAILDFMGDDLDATAIQNWVPNALSLVQAVGGPVISFASDTFQARKFLLIFTCTVSFIGAAIAPGSNNIYRVIVAQILIGFGFAAVPLAYAIPSEILPRRWRPVVQGAMNVAASLGAISGPLIGGILTRESLTSGWKNFYWVQMALWGVTIVGIVVGYRPPKRHTDLDHLSIGQKVARLDLPGMALLSAGLTLLLAGLSLGGNPWAWTDAKVLSTLVIGIALLVGFGVYEWKGTSVGILHHELFQSRTFPVCLALIFIEGILLFTIIIFYPALTGALFETEPFLAALRGIPFWVASGISTLIYGFWSTKFRTIRSPLMVGFVLMTAGLVGISTIQPNQSTRLVIFDALAGLGFGAPLVLIISGVQLSIPHQLIATGTAVVTSSRAVAASSFTAIYAAALTSRTAVKIPAGVAAAAIAAGLPPSSVEAFVGAFLTKSATITSIKGVTPAIIAAAAGGLDQALADSFRVIYIIAAPFGVLACALCWFLGDMKPLMNYKVDAPIENLQAKHRGGGLAASEEAGTV